MASFLNSLKFAGNYERLLLSYNRESTKRPTAIVYNKKVLCEYLTQYDDVDDYETLSRFLHLEKSELYPAVIKTNSAIDDCILFIKHYKRNGYNVFMCIVEYSVYKNAYGNHYIVACKNNDRVYLQAKKLKAREVIYFTESYPCIVLKNYVEVTHDFLELLFPNITSKELRDPIVLGTIENGSSKSISDHAFEKQIANLRIGNFARALLQSIRRRLNFPKEYQLTIDKHVSTAVSNAFTMLSHCLSTLNQTSDVLEIKNIMINMNDQLIIFVSNYYYYLQSVCNGGGKIENHDIMYGLLHQLVSHIRNQSYETYNGVFCVVHSGSSNSTTSVIHVTETNFDLLLSVFRPKGFTSLKFKMVRQTDEDDDWLLETKGSTVKVNLTRLDVSTSSPETDENAVNYVNSCVHNPGTQYNWICVNCETLVKLNQQAKITCACGVQASPTLNGCVKCVPNRILETLPAAESPLKNVEVNVKHQKHNVQNGEEATVTWPERGQSIAKPVNYTVCTATVKASFYGREKAMEVATVQKLPQSYALHAKALRVSVVKNTTNMCDVATNGNIRKSSDKENSHRNNIQCFESCVSLSDSQLSETIRQLTPKDKPISTKTVKIGAVTNDLSSAQRGTDYLSSTSNSVPRSLPPTPLTILVLGRSADFNSGFLEDIYNGKRIELEQTANNMSPNKAGTKTDHGYIINYGLFTVDYINVACADSSIDWTMYPEIHGFIFVLQSERTYAFESELQKMMAMVPRKAISNCCIVNIQTSATSLTKLVNAYRVKHALEDITHFWIDSNLYNHQSHKTRGYIDSLNNVKTNVEEFILKVKESPVTYNELKLTELFTKLGEILIEKPTYRRLGKRLMASVVENTMLDTARYLRMYPHTATPLTNEEWKDAVHWDLDETLLAIIREINKYINTKITASNPVDSKSKTTTTEIAGVDSVCPTITPSNPNYNVLILGSSAANKQLLLNMFYCIQRHATFDDAVQNTETIAFQDSNDYVIDYGTHTVRYISKDDLNSEKFDVHGIVIAVENNTLEVSNTTDNYIRETFHRLPRHAVKNCCIVNTFNSSDTFVLTNAEHQMSQLTKTFGEQHVLADRPNFICLDKAKMRAILNHNVTADVESHQNFYESCKHGINSFLQNIGTVQPVTPNDLQVAGTWKRLCDAFRPHVKARDLETLRLMATIAENTLTGLAIYCRKNKGDAQPLNNDEWPAAVAYWNAKGTKDSTAATIADALNEIYCP